MQSLNKINLFTWVNNECKTAVIIVDSFCFSDVVAESNNPASEDVLNKSLTLEDDRLPSDESFQNYTNGLDFSTNLFDTDRIPNLDISGNSRSETDLNTYGVGNKDDNDLNNTSELFKIPSELDTSNNQLEVCYVIS